MDSVTIPIGRSIKARLGDLYELHGISPEQAASQGMQDYIRKLILEEKELNQLLTDGLQEARGKTERRKEFTE